MTGSRPTFELKKIQYCRSIKSGAHQQTKYLRLSTELPHNTDFNTKNQKQKKPNKNPHNYSEQSEASLSETTVPELLEVIYEAFVPCSSWQRCFSITSA